MKLLSLRHSAPLFVVAACLSASPTEVELVPGGMQVLFIGNSLMYTNDLPWTLDAIASSAGDTIRSAAAASPNAAVIDHTAPGSLAMTLLRKQKWNVVILQQGETPAALCRDTLVLAARRFAPHVAAAGGRVAVFTPWTYAQFPGDLPKARLSTNLAAATVGGFAIPVGEAWAAVRGAHPEISLYSGDGLHPSDTGTWLTALVIYESLTRRDVRTLSAAPVAGGHSVQLSSDVQRILRAAAHEAVAAAQAPYVISVSDTSGVRSPTRC